MNKQFASLLTIVLISTMALSQNYATMVNTRIGSKGNGLGCGYNYIGASYPFGMVQFTPSFFSPQKGFVATQLNGAGCAHMGNFPVIPLSGNLKYSPNDMNKFPKYEHINKAHAGYLSVTMKDSTIAELTANKRSGIAKFTFNEKTGSVIIGSGVSSTFLTNARVAITSDKSCEGFAEGGEFCGSKTDYRIYFAAEFDRPAKKTGTWTKRTLVPEAEFAYGEHSGAFFTFDTEKNKEVTYRIAISFVSVENAKENLKAANTHSTFEAYRATTEAHWNENLGKIAVSSKNEDRKVQFYSHLYHTMIHPNIVSDINGEYMGSDFKVHQTEEGRDYYSSFSVWDTYRTQAQLIAMLYPKESSDMMQSVVDFAEQSGGLGRWVLANIETGIMQGDPTSLLIANSYVFGATDFDVEKAFKYMKKGATVPLTHSQNIQVRPHLKEYMDVGTTFASMMLEYTSADYAIGQFAAKALDQKSEADFFIKRSKNWKNIYNPDLNWLCSKYPNGKWKDIKHDWREATYKDYFWMVPYDLSTLIDTIGGKQFAEKRLDELFVRLDASYDDDWFAAGNEPGFHSPWIYNWTNAPHKTSKTVFRIFDEMYNSTASGLPGNDDLGTLGAWYVFASVGLYPMVPGEAGFSVNTPQFENVKIALPKGELLIKGGSANTKYIRSLKVNGKKHNASWIDWKDIASGGTIDFKTSTRVRGNWGK